MGVKQLWTLLGPVGRPVLLETMEGKTMAIDSSIWLYQFQATMRDKDGRALVNAHVLGFLRRICKLLFYGIKPVFVFDGGAPVLKRLTITERKRKKAGAAENHARVAEKLLAAHLRREALNQVQKSKSGAPAASALDDNTVYLEDLVNNTPQATPSKGKGKAPATQTPDSASKKAKFHDHDPYRLPAVDPGTISKPTSSLAPDPRLATEDELRFFIDSMRPEDFDVNSEAFRDLPTEIKYEIIGDLRLKSRQTSHKRLQKMLQTSKTPLDFSKAQIKNLQQRNTLTQQLLVTTDSISKAGVVIPVRIASERNKEYVLMKNEGEEGGWVLGIRNEGTQDKPIVIDEDPQRQSDGDDSDMEMEEVPIASSSAPPDPDLREFHGRMALAAVSRRQPPPPKPIPRPSRPNTNFKPQSSKLISPKKLPLFIDEDADMDAAIAASLQDEEEEALRQALEASQREVAAKEVEEKAMDEDEDEDFAPSRLDAALRFANTPKRRGMLDAPRSGSGSGSIFGTPTLLLGGDKTTTPTKTDVSPASKLATPPKTSSSGNVSSLMDQDESEDDEDMEEVPVVIPAKQPPVVHISDDSDEDLYDPVAIPSTPSTVLPSTGLLVDSDEDLYEPVSIPSSSTALDTTVPNSTIPVVDSDEDLYDLVPIPSPSTQPSSGTLPNPPIQAVKDSDQDFYEVEPAASALTTASAPSSATGVVISSSAPQIAHSISSQNVTTQTSSSMTILNDTPVASSSKVPTQSNHSLIDPFSDDDEPLTDWERSSTPIPLGIHAESSHSPRKDEDDHWDAAQEMDVIAEEKDFTQFVSQMKGKDLDAARMEIDEEIRVLNKQKKVAMRDSEDITQHMISQIMLMLRLFGIPYITAPMEAEAQCAKLVSLGLVEGIITDDSDVFLFGGARVFKNMFNQSKTVECFLLNDLSRELGLDRDKLVRLAYLLGSDYVDGLPGVGPVVAMEILKEFPGEDGLVRFREWWRKVQSGKDMEEDSKSAFRKRFKRRFKDLYLPEDWPNLGVRDAYYHPSVDESEEPFKWGLPDLDSLHQFLREELSWSQSKVDDLLVPIIRKVGQREQNAASNRQGTLDNYFDVSLGGGNYAPRKQQAYSSKRLQQVVADFRAQQKSGGSSITTEDDSCGRSDPPIRKRKAKGDSKPGGPARKRERGGKAAGRNGRKKKDANESSESERQESIPELEEVVPVVTKQLRPRPKPRPKPVPVEDADEGEDKSDDDGDVFVVKRSGRKL